LAPRRERERERGRERERRERGIMVRERGIIDNQEVIEGRW
jgi:hypothetical protein